MQDFSLRSKWRGLCFLQRYLLWFGYRVIIVFFRNVLYNLYNIDITDYYI